METEPPFPLPLFTLGVRSVCMEKMVDSAKSAQGPGWESYISWHSRINPIFGNMHISRIHFVEIFDYHPYMNYFGKMIKECVWAKLDTQLPRAFYALQTRLNATFRWKVSILQPIQVRRPKGLRTKCEY